MSRVQDVKAFLSQKGTKRVREHLFTSRILNWTYCSQCGLVCLKNDRTRRAMAEKCVTWE